MVKGQNDIILKKMQIEADLAVAEIETKSQVLGERIEFVHDLVKQLIGQAHESGMAAQNAQQTQDLTAQQGQQQSDLQSQAQEADNGDQSDSSAQAGQG
jgi:hypothetical protein